MLLARWALRQGGRAAAAALGGRTAAWQAPAAAALDGSTAAWQALFQPPPRQLQQQSQQQQQQQRRCYGDKAEGERWHFLQAQGHAVNPCNSMLHPAVKEAGIMPEGEQEVAVQVAYTPKSHCFGCGPAHPEGLHLQSKRIENGLEARVSIPAKYCAFPGILNGGIISTLLDCHGNWTAAIALMDRSCLPKPPLTLTASMLVSYKEPSPPDTELVVRSHVVAVRENQNPGLGKAAVEVDVAVLLPQPGGSEKLLVQGTGIFKRLGALRAL